MKVKYITFKNAKFDSEDIIVFTGIQQHADVARSMELRSEDIIGAGFIRATKRGSGVAAFECYGESTSLEVESQGDIDNNIANLFLQDMIF